MFLFCSHRVKRAVQRIKRAVRCLFAAALNESAGAARVGRVTRGAKPKAGTKTISGA